MRHFKSLVRLIGVGEAVSESEAPEILEVSDSSTPNRDEVLRVIPTLADIRDAKRSYRLSDVLSMIDLLPEKAAQESSILAIKADTLISLGRTDEAITCCRAALSKNPISITHLSLLESIGVHTPIDIKTAEDFILRSNGSAVHYLSAARYLNKGFYFLESLRYSELGLKRKTDDATRDALLAVRGSSFEYLNSYSEALNEYLKIRGPKQRKATLQAISRCELELGNFEASARASGLPVLWHDEIPVYGKSTLPALYSLGHIRAAHASYRTRRTSLDLAEAFGQESPLNLSVRSGAYKDGNALILVEGGPGDEIRFASIYNELRQCFRSLTMSCDPRLFTMMTRSFPDIEFIPVKRHRAEFRSENLSDRSLIQTHSIASFVNDEAVKIGRECSIVASILDVICEFRGDTVSDFRASPGRLIPCVKEASRWGKSDRLKVGIAWRSLLSSPHRNIHYLRAEDLKGLAGLNADFWILQAGATDDEIALIQETLENVVVPDVDLKDDFEAQAGLISSLDFVISPFTTTAELSGMLGQKTLLLSTSKSTLWRRLPDGQDIWYKTGRLLSGTPAEVVSAAAAEVDQQVRRGHSSKFRIA